MRNVGVRKLAREQGQIAELGRDCSEIFDVERESKGTWRHRIVRHEPRFHLRIVSPGSKEPIRLNRLATKDTERGRHDGDANLGHGTATYGRSRSPARPGVSLRLARSAT